MDSKYDIIIIGAGMAGMAAAIRLSKYGKKTLVLEKHAIPGGLNSYYSKDGRRFDVGLHAMTNFVPANVKSSPLGKILRQLRIRHHELDLVEQNYSKISFPGVDLEFGNSFTRIEESISSQFPQEIDGFRRLVSHINEYDEVSLSAEYISAKETIAKFLKEPLLQDMIFCPVMYYGSAVEDDMDFSQFCIMFKSIFLEGFCRPEKGVRHLIRLLRKKINEAGAEVKFRCGVKKIFTDKGRATAVETGTGQIIEADIILSSAGGPETFALCADAKTEVNKGQLSFVESLIVCKGTPSNFGFDETIVFFSKTEQFNYKKAQNAVDFSSGVICLPNNFQYKHSAPEEGIIRFTSLANYDKWKNFSESEYLAQKEAFVKEQVNSSPYADFINTQKSYVDAFTPTTVAKYTSHFNGAIYGSPDKIKDGRTEYENLFIMGTDQGFLGIVGAILSGISIANLYGLK